MLGCRCVGCMNAKGVEPETVHVSLSREELSIALIALRSLLRLGIHVPAKPIRDLDDRISAILSQEFKYVREEPHA